MQRPAVLHSRLVFQMRNILKDRKMTRNVLCVLMQKIENAGFHGGRNQDNVAKETRSQVIDHIPCQGMQGLYFL